MGHTTRSVLHLPAAVALATLLILTVACGGGEEPPAPEDAGATTPELTSERVAVGTALEDDGSLAPGSDSRRFAAGDTVHLSFEPEPQAEATEVELVWYGPDGLDVATDAATVEPGRGHVPFSTDTSGWDPGTYRAEVWQGNELVEELEIEVTGAG